MHIPNKSPHRSHLISQDKDSKEYLCAVHRSAFTSSQTKKKDKKKSGSKASSGWTAQDMGQLQ
jgi:hypothetical protein